IDWLCLPRFDSGACFAALLGGREHGRWLLRPEGEVKSTKRRYREGSLVLETDYETADGAVTVTDCIPIRAQAPDLVPLRGRQAWSGADENGADHSLRLWFDCALGEKNRRGPLGRGRA